MELKRLQTAKLVNISKANRNSLAYKARRAIYELFKVGRPISVLRVANWSGVTRQTIYSDPEIRALVEYYKNYQERHVASDWDFMMDYLKRIYPKDYKEAVTFFDTNLYSPCNMFIMKKEILDKLCTWLFPILFVCAEHSGEREDSYQNRYPGFLAERLMTFFFEKNREQIKVVYADKEFLA